MSDRVPSVDAPARTPVSPERNAPDGLVVLGAGVAGLGASLVSGAPVYDKCTHAFVGIVFAGGNPARRGPRTSWENHEAILPAPVIAAELDAAGLLTEP